MTILITILIVGSIWHFVYEAIILPSLRLSLRFQLFELRDRIRLLKYEAPEMFKDDAFEYLHRSVTNAIAFLHKIDLGLLFKGVNEAKKDKQISRQIEKKEKMLRQAQLGEVWEIQQEFALISTKILLANHGAWAIYLVPIALILMFLGKLKGYVITLSYVPEHKMRHIIPPERLSLV